MLSNHVDLVENEIKNLLNETKKKYNNIKEILTEAHTKIAEVKLDPSKDLPMNEILKALKYIPETKNSKLIILGLNCFQKFLNNQILKKEHFTEILEYLHNIREVPDEGLHIKMLQTLHLLLNPKIIDFNSLEFIEKLYHICFLMFNSKNILIHNTSSAALFQLTDIYFDNLTSLFNNLNNEISINDDKNIVNEKILQNYDIYKNGITLIRDFIQIANGQRPQWLPNVSQINYKNIALDLILNVLKQCGSTFQKIKEFSFILQTNFIPLIKKSFNPQNIEFIYVLRMIRSITRIIVNLRHGFELVPFLLSYLESKELYSYQKFLSLESLSMIFSDYDLLHLFYKYTIDHTLPADFYSNLLNIIQKVSKEICSLPESELKKTSPIHPKLNKIISSNITELDPPALSANLMFRLIIEGLSSLTDSFSSICEKAGIKIGTKIKIHEMSEEILISIQHLENSWKPILKSIKIVIAKDVDEIFTQQILNIIQSWINLTGTLMIVKARDSYLRIICNASCPKEFNAEFNAKHIQISKTLFNIAHCLGGVLDANSWHIILETFQKSEAFYLRLRLPKTNQQQNLQEDANINSDLLILSSALDTLFTNSNQYCNENLVILLDALNQLTIECMEKVATNENAQTSISINTFDLSKQKIFGLTKMQEVINANLFRIEVFWDLVIAHFLCIANSKNANLRKMAVETLNTFINSSFSYFFMEIKKGNKHEIQKAEKLEENILKHQTAIEKLGEEKWSIANWQKTLLQPWLDVIKSKFNETKESVLNCLLRLLQDNGHEITNSGWSAILSILKEISDDASSNNTNTAFQCVELLVNQYLHVLNYEKFGDLLNIIENFKRNSMENNIHYISVGLFWNIGDFLAQNKTKGEPNISQEDFEELWSGILGKMISLCLDNHSEVRLSALHVFSSILQHHGNLLTMGFWIKIFNSMFFTIYDRILEIYLSFFYQNQSNMIQTPKFNTFDSSKLSKNILERAALQNAENKEKKVSFSKNQGTEKQWEETIKILIPSFSKILKKFCSYTLENGKDVSKLLEIIKKSLDKMKMLIGIHKIELLYEALKFLNELTASQKDFVLQQKNEFDKVLNGIQDWLSKITSDQKELKTILGKIVPLILELIDNMFSKEEIKTEFLSEYGEILFDILANCLFYPKKGETFNAISAYKIFIDDKPIFDYMEKIPSFLKINPNKEFHYYFFNFLFEILSKDVLDKFNENMIRKFLLISTEILTDKTIVQNFSLDIIEQYLEKMKSLIFLKFNHEYQTICIQNNRSASPLWAMATNELIKVLPILIIDFNIFKLLYDIFHSLLVFKSERKSPLSNENLEEYQKVSAESNVSFLNFIVDNLLCEETQLSEELSEKFLCLIDTFCGLDKKSKIMEEENDELNLEQLFRICQVGKENEKKEKISKKLLPSLLLKCKGLIESYLHEENMFGGISVPRIKINNLNSLFQKLINLEIPNNSFLDEKSFEINEKEEDQSKKIEVKFSCNPYLNGKKGHLFYLLPLISKCLMSKEQDIRPSLKIMLDIISSEMDILRFY